MDKINTKIAEPKDYFQSLETRLGTVSYKSEDLFLFDNGLYGFETCNNFIIASLPYEGAPDNFKMLQSVENTNLAFIVLNVLVDYNLESSIISADDLEIYLKQQNLQLNEVSVFLIVSINEEYVSVNTKAPIILIPKLQKGLQLILDGEKYSVNHKLI